MRAHDIADPFEAARPEFRTLQGDVRWTTLWDGGGWLEGPSWNRAGLYLVFSDIPANQLLRWDPVTGGVGVFRDDAGFPNGTAYDREGRLLVCEQGRRRITRTEHDGQVVAVASRFGDVSLNSPNDLVVRRDGVTFFTDPPYGILGSYEGIKAPIEQASNRVYRLDTDGAIEVAAEGFERPTGIGLSPDEQRLYVADSRTSTIRAFGIHADGTLFDGRTLVTSTTPSLDSMAVDEDGRIWIAAMDGVHCYDPLDGTLIGKVHLPDPASHVEFGGERGNTLFVCATTALCSVRLTVRGSSWVSRQ